MPSVRDGISTMFLALLMGNMLLSRSHPMLVRIFTTTKGSIFIIIMAVVDANYKFIWLNIGTNSAAGEQALEQQQPEVGDVH